MTSVMDIRATAPDLLEIAEWELVGDLPPEECSPHVECHGRDAECPVVRQRVEWSDPSLPDAARYSLPVCDLCVPEFIPELDFDGMIGIVVKWAEQ